MGRYWQRFRKVARFKSTLGRKKEKPGEASEERVNE